jgi:hypothetical protein
MADSVTIVRDEPTGSLYQTVILVFSSTLHDAEATEPPSAWTTQYRAANEDMDIADSDWATYPEESQINWRLSNGAGVKTVTVQYRTAGNDASITEVTAVTRVTVWWPEGYLDPAFQVRREIYGPVSGGDFVRGSAGDELGGELARTALRYPSTVEITRATFDVKAFLHIRPYDHYFITENLKNAQGIKVGERKIPVGTIEIEWDWPPQLSMWQEVVLVRSSFGRPSTPNDGQVVFRRGREAFLNPNPALPDIPPPVVLDRPLPTGYWYYYALFFRVTTTQWIKSMFDSTLLPRDFHHAEHLWNAVPPYYQWTDDNYQADGGFLRQFLSVFGFELDTWREYIESWQYLYNIDRSPIRLLRHLGNNFGFPYEQGVGDIRYRSFLTRVGHLLETQGTYPGLKGVVEQMSKYACSLTFGANMMLLPDDSDMYMGTGHWVDGGGIPFIETIDPSAIIDYGVSFSRNSLKVTVPPLGRGSMRVVSVKDPASPSMLITCGMGTDDSTGNEVIPLYAGIPVQSGNAYSFSVWIKSELTAVAQAVLLWCNSAGDLWSLIPDEWAQGPTLSTTSSWQSTVVKGIAPTGDQDTEATYVVPGILFINRDVGTDPDFYPWIDVAGAMVSDLGPGDAVETRAPDQYLTLGDPAEKIGVETETQKGYVIGAPKT